MGIRILVDKDNEMAVIYCSTSGVAFGPIIDANNGVGAEELAQAFLDWLVVDPRLITDNELLNKWGEFCRLESRECPECLDTVIGAEAEACYKCLHRCNECGDDDVDTAIVTVRNEKKERFCEKCIRILVDKDYP